MKSKKTLKMKNHSKFYLIPLISAMLFANLYCKKEEPTSQAELSTLPVTDITLTSAQSGGNITNDGGGLITSRGLVWSTSSNPTIEQHLGLTMNGNGNGMFQSMIADLQPNTNYYLRAYAANEAGMAYGNEQQFKTLGTVASLTTSKVSGIIHNSALTGGDVTNDGGESITARGAVWSTYPNPSLESNSGSTNDGIGTGSFTSTMTGLSANTNYFVRAYATNDRGTSYGQQEIFTTFETHVVEVLNPTTGRIWMDRNLGATRAATGSNDSESYGDIYQWGRGADGHQKRTSSLTLMHSYNDTPGHESFIASSNTPYDWRNPQNNDLWQGIVGINNPCPEGYRLPTEAEWEEERQSWISNDAAGAIASPLKLPMAGHRYGYNGSLSVEFTTGLYWASSTSFTTSKALRFEGSGINDNFFTHILNYMRVNGCSVRCIKE
jgi:uncharacterized protein (TIGR02145 family)